jgi:hypothetical protein
VRGWRAPRLLAAAASGALLALSGCGGDARQDANEPSGDFPVSVTRASFPTSQQLSQHSHLVLTIRNSGNKTIPDLAVTICNLSCHTPEQASQSGGAQAFSEVIHQPGLANPSRPVWIVDRAPGPCGYACRTGGPGAYVTAYTNTWASGALRPGASVTFDWGVTAVKPGRHVLAYQIAAGLNGKAKAMASDGSIPSGTFHVVVSARPRQSYVTDGGQIVYH